MGGQTLTADPGAWTGAPTSYQYAWQRCNSSGNGCGTISGATGTTYLLVAADNGHTIRVEVTGDEHARHELARLLAADRRRR